MKQAIVLAAGCGRRLLPYTEHVPKPLIEVSDRPILVRLISQFVSRGVTSWVIVIGDRGAKIREVLDPISKEFGLHMSYIENMDYLTTNNSYSLWSAREFLATETFILEADVIADDTVIDTMCSCKNDTFWFVRPFENGMDGAFLEGEIGEPLQRLSIIRGGAAPTGPGFKSMGMLRLSTQAARNLRTWLEAEVQSGNLTRYYDLVFADHAGPLAPRLMSIPAGKWLEIDTPDDLRLAKSLFSSKI
jgi:choline kinase